MSKEDIFNEQIKPLLEELTTLCRDERINTIMVFILGRNEQGHIISSSTIVPEDMDDRGGLIAIDNIVNDIFLSDARAIPENKELLDFLERNVK